MEFLIITNMIEKIDIFLKLFNTKEEFNLNFHTREGYITHGKDRKLSISFDYSYHNDYNIETDKYFMILLEIGYKIQYND